MAKRKGILSRIRYVGDQSEGRIEPFFISVVCEDKPTFLEQIEASFMEKLKEAIEGENMTNATAGGMTHD